MTSKEFKLRERALTLFCTGKYDSKESARAAAKEQISREELKKKPISPYDHDKHEDRGYAD